MRQHAISILTLIAAALALPAASGADLSDAARAELEQQLEQTREELQRLSERLAELSLELVEQPGPSLSSSPDGPRIVHRLRSRVAIGVTIQGASGERGAQVLAVTPDGPADRAGIRTGDVIVGVDDLDLDDADTSASRLVTRFMRDVEPGQTLVVRLERDGEPMTVRVVAEKLEPPAMLSFDFDTETFDELGENIEKHVMRRFGDGGDGALAFVFRRGPWADMEVVELTPTLGDYFGVREGLLVVRAPDDDKLDLREGDVIVRAGGIKLADQRQLGQILAAAGAHDTIRLEIVRQRQSMTIDATVPEGTSFDPRGPHHRLHRFVDGED